MSQRYSTHSHARHISRPSVTEVAHFSMRYDIIGNPFNLQIGMDKIGSLHYWLADALDSKRWQWLIDSRLRFPHRNIPEPSNPNEDPPYPLIMVSTLPLVFEPYVRPPETLH